MKPRWQGRGTAAGASPMSPPPLCLPQGCRIYLCGTKSDLLEEDRRKRGVDFHDVQDYADGRARRRAGTGRSWLGTLVWVLARLLHGWGLIGGMESPPAGGTRGSALAGDPQQSRDLPGHSLS